MTLNLSVADRIKLLTLLPNEGNIFTLRIIRDLQNQLSFSEDEHKVLNLKQDGDRVQWDPISVSSKEVEIGEKAIEVFKKSLQTLSEQDRLRADMLDLYDMFVKD